MIELARITIRQLIEDLFEVGLGIDTLGFGTDQECVQSCAAVTGVWMPNE